MRLLAATVALALGMGQAQAGEWRATGQALVIDGNRLWLLDPVKVICFDLAVCGASNIVHPDGIEIRLRGIDAFELHQTCNRKDGKIWRCGYASKEFLVEIVQDKPITCYGGRPGLAWGREERETAVCYLGHRNLNEDMVRMGLALASRRQSNDYVETEKRARALRTGAWAGTFVPPWDWRRGLR